MIMASSAANEGGARKTVIASAPIAEAQSERRLNWLRDMGLPLRGGLKGSLERQSPGAIGAGLPDVPRYAAGRVLLPPDGHEFVNKCRGFQDVTAARNHVPHGEEAHLRRLEP